MYTPNGGGRGVSTPRPPNVIVVGRGSAGDPCVFPNLKEFHSTGSCWGIHGSGGHHRVRRLFHLREGALTLLSTSAERDSWLIRPLLFVSQYDRGFRVLSHGVLERTRRGASGDLSVRLGGCDEAAAWQRGGGRCLGRDEFCRGKECEAKKLDSRPGVLLLYCGLRRELVSGPGGPLENWGKDDEAAVGVPLLYFFYLSFYLLST